MSHHRQVWLIFTALLILLAASPVSAQNLLTNGDFTAVVTVGNTPQASRWARSHGSYQVRTSGSFSPPNHVWMWTAVSTGGQVVGEGIVQGNLSIAAGDRCSLRYAARHAGTAGTDREPLDNVVVGLSRAATSGIPIANPRSGDLIPRPGGQVVDQLTSFQQPAWTQRSVSFVADADYDQLYVYPSQTLGRTPLDNQTRQGWLEVDDLVLTCCDRELDPSFNVTVPACGEEPVVGTANDSSDGIGHRWDLLPLADGKYVEQGTFQCWSASCEMSYPFEPGTCYGVKHGVWTESCPWREERQVICIPEVHAVTGDCKDPAICERITCPPDERFFDEPCGCGCEKYPASCDGRVAEAGPERTLCPGSRTSEIRLGSPPLEGCRYRWTPADGLSNAGAAQPSLWLAEMDGPTTYELEMECDNGCRSRDQVTVRPGPSVGPVARTGGGWGFLACGGTVTLGVDGYSSGGALVWQCSDRPPNPRSWKRCGTSTGGTFTVGPLDQDLWVRVCAYCGTEEVCSNAVPLRPFCVSVPDGTTAPPDLDPQPPAGSFDFEAEPGSGGAPAVPGGEGDGSAAEASQAPAPRITDCSPRAVGTQEVCVCGRFPTAASRRAVTLDGETLGEPLRSAPEVLWFRLPEALAAGAHGFAGLADAGYSAGDRCAFEGLAVAASLDQSQLYRGRGTDLRLEVSGSREPVRLRLTNGTPAVVRVEGGDDQWVTTSGGQPNAARRRVRGLERGEFDLGWEVEAPACPCAP